MFGFFKKNTPPEPVKPHEPLPLTKQVIQMLKAHPHKWGYRWHHNDDIYALCLSNKDEEIIVHIHSGHIQVNQKGHTIKDNTPSSGSLTLSADDRDKALIMKAANQAIVARTQKFLDDKDADIRSAKAK